MTCDVPRKIIGELISLLGSPHEAKRLPPTKSKARNIYCDVAAIRIRRKVVDQPPPHVLESCFVELARVDCPHILRCDAGIAEGLLRSSGISILTEILGRT